MAECYEKLNMKGPAETFRKKVEEIEKKLPKPPAAPAGPAGDKKDEKKDTVPPPPPAADRAEAVTSVGKTDKPEASSEGDVHPSLTLRACLVSARSAVRVST